MRAHQQKELGALLPRRPIAHLLPESHLQTSVPTFQISRHPLSLGPLTSPLLPNHPIEYLLPPSYLSIKNSDKSALKTAFDHYYFSLTLLEDALTAFLAHRYNQFDALIGNNSCYLVAYVIYLLGREDRSLYESALCNICALKHRLLLTIQNLKLLKGTTFWEILKDNSLEPDVELGALYLTMAYGCTITKEITETNIETICFIRLVKKYEGNPFVELKEKSMIKMIKHWQRLISYINVTQLQSHAQWVSEAVKPWSRYIESPFVLTDKPGRLCSSSLYSSRVILDLLKSMPGAVIGLQVNIGTTEKEFFGRAMIYYQVNDSGEWESITEDLSEQPIYLFIGCRYVQPGVRVDLKEIEREFQGRNVEEIILAHEVTYPQYPKSLGAGEVQPSDAELMREINRLKEFSGFSLDNPSDLCLVHISVTNPSEVFTKPVFLPQIS